MTSISYIKKSMPTTNVLSQTASELESIRCLPLHDGVEFPAAARSLLYLLPGNTTCVDCGALHPQWASVSYGALMCLQCSGKHRSYGVQTSFVRSLDMDTWSHAQILAMLEGGNEQLQQFFERHHMGSSAISSMRNRRYHTKAAKFYRTHLSMHVEQVSASGIYKGREASRRIQASSISNESDSCSSETSCQQEQPPVPSKQPYATSPRQTQQTQQSIAVQ